MIRTNKIFKIMKTDIILLIYQIYNMIPFRDIINNFSIHNKVHINKDINNKSLGRIFQRKKKII